MTVVSGYFEGYITQEYITGFQRLLDRLYAGTSNVTAYLSLTSARPKDAM